MSFWVISVFYVLYLYCFSFATAGTEAICKCSYADCEDHWMVGHSQNGEYQVVPLGMVDGFNMMCDMDSGWTIIQKHINGGVDFDKTWKDYEAGFGDDLSTGYWIGLWRLWTIVQQGHYKLRISIRYPNNTQLNIVYKSFRIGGPEENYKLKAYLISEPNDAGDSLTSQNGHQFSTKDRDNDNSTQNCAAELGGGWWFSDCGQSNLNGNHISEAGDPSTGGILWETMEPGKMSRISATKMMIKRN